jgi:hypothetical protein
MKKQNQKGPPTCMTGKITFHSLFAEMKLLLLTSFLFFFLPLAVYTPNQQLQQRKPSKKSLFRSPLRNNSVAIRSRPSRDQHSFMEHSNNSVFLSPFNESTTRFSQDSNGARPTDVLKAASALLPGMNKHPDLNRSQTSLGIAKAYNHIDFPRRPSARSHNESTSVDSDSLSVTRHVNSQSSQDEQPEEDKINMRPQQEQQEIKWPTRSASITNEATHPLDDLSSVLPHIDRATLQTYLDRADGDYMQALDLCKQAVKNGEL